MKHSACAALAILTLCGGIASAEPDVPTGPKSRELARTLAIAGTLASTAVIALGAATWDAKAGKELVVGGALSTLVTPSIGAWYAEQPLTVGMMLRAAPAALALVVATSRVVQGLGCVRWDENSPPCPPPAHGPLSDTNLLVLGGAIYVAGIVYDIIDAPSVADHYNVQYRFRLAPGFALTPSGTVPTLGLSRQF